MFQLILEWLIKTTISALLKQRSIDEPEEEAEEVEKAEEKQEIGNGKRGERKEDDGSISNISSIVGNEDHDEDRIEGGVSSSLDIDVDAKNQNLDKGEAKEEVKEGQGKDMEQERLEDEQEQMEEREEEEIFFGPENFVQWSNNRIVLSCLLGYLFVHGNHIDEAIGLLRECLIQRFA